MPLFRHISLLLVAALLAACSFDRKLQEEGTVDDRLPMVFGSSYSQAEAQATKASAPLESDFKVWTWKAFGTAGQQNVMDGYKVEYTASATSYKWNYVNVNGQPERYWDQSAYPYEFRAVAPCRDGYSITPSGISLNASAAPFRSQSLVNDVYNYSSAESEAAVVAHVKRQQEDDEYADYDIIKNAEINTSAKSNSVREVHMPFHHLISKIGFRVFIDNPMPLYNDYSISIQSITISVLNPDNNFIIASAGYSATNEQGLATGTFTNNTTATGEYVLLSHGLYMDNNESHWNFHYHLNQADAFDLTPGCLQQIPQSGVKLHVQLHMHTHHVEADDVEFDFDRCLSLDKTNLEGDLFTWEPDYKYIYYLHIPNLHGHEILLHTCEILPWDEVQTTDIPVEL